MGLKGTKVFDWEIEDCMGSYIPAKVTIDYSSITDNLFIEAPNGIAYHNVDKLIDFLSQITY